VKESDLLGEMEFKGIEEKEDVQALFKRFEWLFHSFSS
jgi:hypothetical protein